MNLKKSLPLAYAPLDYFDDGTTLYLLMSYKSSTQVVAYDAAEFKPLGAFWVEDSVLENTYLMGEDCIYLITDEGVVAFDSFTGDKLRILKTGSLLPISLCVCNGRIFVLCGVPLAAGTSLNTGNLCVSVHDPETGERISQTQNVTGEYFGPVSDAGVWLVSGRRLYKFDQDGELQAEIPLYTNAGFAPILTDAFVVVASELGTLEIFDRNSFKPISKILVEKNSSPPICHKDTIYWATGKQIQQVDPVSGQFRILWESENNISASCLFDGGKMFFGSGGSMFQVDIATGQHESIKLEDGELWKPVKSHSGDIYIASHSALHQIEV